MGWSEAIPHRTMPFKDRAQRAMVRPWDEAKQSHTEMHFKDRAQRAMVRPWDGAKQSHAEMHFKDRAQRAMVRLWDGAKHPTQKCPSRTELGEQWSACGMERSIPLTVSLRMKACSGQPEGLSRTNAFQAQQPSYKYHEPNYSGQFPVSKGRSLWGPPCQGGFRRVLLRR